jgi:predicted nucleotidyltransferase
MYVAGPTSEKLFAATRQLPGPGGVTIAVPRPEHLIAIKVQAMKDAPERTWQDLVDIAYLLRLPGVDRGEVENYFTRAGLAEKWREVRDAP